MLKRVSIQNFKSLKDVTLDLQKVNLLIGPNNSGKTDFLKALESIFLLVTKKQNLKDEDHFKKDYDNLLKILLVYEIKAKSSKITYTSILTRSDFIEYDNIETDEDQADEVEDEPPIYYEVYGAKEYKDPTNLDSYEEVVNEYIFKIDYGSYSIYKPDPNKLDKPAPVGRGDSTVAADASNLIAFFDRIRDEYPGTFAQIKADLAKCVPEFTEINFQNVESTEVLVTQFGDKTFKRIGLTEGRQNTIYWADELSEGTLYFIALLCIINQPNPPKLLLLEEPEKGIHPRRIFEVIQFIFRLAEEKDVQVIMTTHSPIVVDMFKDMPESVFIFDKDDEGATHVKNLQRDVIEPEVEKSKELGIEPHHYTDSLGDAWTVGFLGGVPK